MRGPKLSRTSHEAAHEGFASALAKLEYLEFSAEEVLQDLEAMRTAYPDPDRHSLALEAVLDQLAIIPSRLPGKDLTGNFAGWRRHAFQSVAARKERADVRVVYRMKGQNLELLGFGHRWSPAVFYRRATGRPATRDVVQEKGQALWTST